MIRRTHRNEYPNRTLGVAVYVVYSSIAGLLPDQTLFSQFLDELARSLGYQGENHYAVVVDAGSSGSRVHAYKFRETFTLCGSKNLELVEEFYEPTRPGLSSYADDPAKYFAGGRDNIVRLIKNAEHLIPEDRRRSTPLVVRATAGLRLLPKEKALELIDQVSLSIRGLGFNTSGNSVDIMDGKDEGIAIWYAVNLLKGLTNGDTMAALDLGGGSTQITYQIDDDATDQYPDNDLHVFNAGTKNVTLFSHSYLHLGSFAGRYGILRLGAQDMSTNVFTSVCMHPYIKGESWTYSNQQYTISGAPHDGMSRDTVYGRCHKLVREYVLMTMDLRLQEPPAREVAAMSGYYYTALTYGIIEDEDGGPVSVAQYRSRAIEECWKPNVEHPWGCLDLVYVVTLLQDGYEMEDLHTVTVLKKINGHEVSWALGIAYTTVLRQVAGEAAAVAL